MECGWKKNWSETREHLVRWWKGEGFVLGMWGSHEKNQPHERVINPGPARAGAMARIAVKKGAHFLIYGFKDRAIDKAVINALGDEIARSATICPARPAKDQP